MHVERRQVSAQTDDQWVTMTVNVRDPMWEEWVTLELQATVNLTVLPREGESEAYFKLYKDAGLLQEVSANSKIGGTVYPVLYVELGPGCKVADQSTIIRVTDLYDQYFNQTVYTHDLVPGPDYLSFTDATGWEREQGDGNWAPAPANEPPNSNANQGGADRMVYRYKMTWLTHKKPLGNNGPHRLEADPKITFQKYTVGSGWGDDEQVGPSSLEPECENVYIKSCTANPGNIDYFKWDPDGEGALAAPTITLKIADADPHKYCGTIRFRQTMGFGTWDWDNGGWSWMHFDCGNNMTYTINLTEEDEEGHHLDENNEWGTYTYDIIILEYENTPVWTQGEALDWNFLKRYRDGYHLWVPEFRPPPNEDKPGHRAWIRVPEDSPSELRGYYYLASDWNQNEEAQVQRGQGARIVVVDPELSDRSSVSVPDQVGCLGTEYGTVDVNNDGEFDGLMLHRFQTSDPPGIWRAIFTAVDNAGVRSAKWRTHDAMQMLTANQSPPPNRLVTDNYDQHVNPLTELDKVAASYQKKKGYDARANGAKGRDFYVGALPADQLLYSYGHGSEGGGQVSTSTGVICAEDPPPPGGAFLYLENYSMPHGLLAVWNHCHTHDTDPNFGCIAQKTVDIGAACAVGFAGGSIPQDWDMEGTYTPHPPAHWWTHYLWGSLCGEFGYPPMGVTDAVNEAKEMMLTYQHYLYNSDNARVRPEGYNGKIVPKP